MKVHSRKQIRKERKMNEYFLNNAKEDIEKFLRTPQDISKKTLEEQANTLTLAFIGYLAIPTGISKELLEKCCEAFNNNRGKFEWEEEAILTILKKAEN
jgi:hypothetical protein